MNQLLTIKNKKASQTTRSLLVQIQNMQICDSIVYATVYYQLHSVYLKAMAIHLLPVASKSLKTFSVEICVSL
jgi:hypothetical protein